MKKNCMKVVGMGIALAFQSVMIMACEKDEAGQLEDATRLTGIYVNPLSPGPFSPVRKTVSSRLPRNYDTKRRSKSRPNTPRPFSEECLTLSCGALDLLDQDFSEENALEVKGIVHGAGAEETHSLSLSDSVTPPSSSDSAPDLSPFEFEPLDQLLAGSRKVNKSLPYEITQSNPELTSGYVVVESPCPCALAMEDITPEGLRILKALVVYKKKCQLEKGSEVTLDDILQDMAFGKVQRKKDATAQTEKVE